MKKIEALSSIFDSKDGLLIVASISEIQSFKRELASFNEHLGSVINYGVFDNSKDKALNIGSFSVMFNGKTLHFLTTNQFQELISK